MSVFLGFCERESAPYCDLNQPLVALEEASIKLGNKEYDCFHGTNACVSPGAARALDAEALAVRPTCFIASFQGCFGAAWSSTAQPCSSAVHLHQKRPILPFHLESVRPLPRSRGVLRIFRFFFEKQSDAEMINLTEKVLEAEKQSLTSQTQSKSKFSKGDYAAKSYAWWCSEPPLFLRSGGLGGSPWRWPLCCKAKSTHVTFQFSSVSSCSWLNNPNVCCVGRASGAWEPLWGTVGCYAGTRLTPSPETSSAEEAADSWRRMAVAWYDEQQRNGIQWDRIGVSELDGLGKGVPSPTALERSHWHLGH